MKVSVIPDKYKGTLTAGNAARAIAKGWRHIRPNDKLDLLPMTDGGDGFGEVMSGLFRARVQKLKTVDAAHRPCAASWWWEPVTKTAIIESAAIIGLAMLPPGKFHPFALGTFGLGAALRAAAAKGARNCLIGIGGSATNDAGFGLASALGWIFLDRNLNRIERWTDLHRLETIQPAPRCQLGRVTVAVDVQNPLLGLRGATRVYGPQKGLRAGDFAPAEKCLRRLVAVSQKDIGRNLARLPGAGAAGGLGFGLMAFADAKLESGFDLFARQSRLERRLQAADLVIVGEGLVDSSTFMGKGVGQIVKRCRNLGIPCVALAGSAELKARERTKLTQVNSLMDLTSARQAKAKPDHWLELLAAEAARKWNHNSDEAVAIGRVV